MGAIGRFWAGNLYGTNTGNLFLDIDSSEDGALKGIVRIQDHVFGLAIYDVEGEFDGQTLALKGEPRQSQAGVEVSTVEVEGKLTENGLIRGHWESGIGTAGTFVLHPHDNSEQLPTASTAPEQLHASVRQVGAVRLYSDDVRSLIEFIRKDFNNRPVIVCYRERRIESNLYADAFLEKIEHLGEQRYLRLFVQEPDLHGINKAVTVELTANGVNEIRVQGAQEAWVTGEAESIAAFMSDYEKRLITPLRKFGLNLNGLMLLIVIALLPDLDLSRRFIFLGVVVILVVLVAQLHKRFIPNALIYLSPRRPTTFSRLWPTALSWAVGVTSALVAAIAYGLMTGEYNPF